MVEGKEMGFCVDLLFFIKLISLRVFTIKIG